jgi:DNA (cytosine-5)-methyltransferase 1
MFAGAGGAALGLRQAGFHSLAAIEYEPRIAATLARAGFPAIVGRVEDPVVIEEVARNIEASGHKLDLLWASPPCQPYSSAGVRQGKFDPRDGWGATLIYAQRFYPRAIIIENVRGAPVEDWALALRRLCPYAGTFSFLSSDFGLPQTRPRDFVYAGPAPLSALIARMNRHKVPARSVEDVLPHLRGYYIRPEQTTARARSTSQACHTLTTVGNVYVHKKDLGARTSASRIDPTISRLLTIEELAAIQGFPADWPWPATKKWAYKMVGNAVSPPVARAIAISVREIFSAA